MKIVVVLALNSNLAGVLHNHFINFLKTYSLYFAVFFFCCCFFKQCQWDYIINPFIPNPALKRVKTGWLLRIFKNSYFIARTFRLHTQVPNALEKHLK